MIIDTKRTSINGKASCYVVGPMRLQNELIASHLKEVTSSECLVVEEIQQVGEENYKEKGNERLFFLDCQGKNLNAVLSEVKPFASSKRSNNRFVLFNVPVGVEFKRKFILRGIAGFFYENDPLDNFMKGVQALLDGQLWFTRDMMTKFIFEEPDGDQSSNNMGETLTERQIEILALIAVGSTNDEISDKLCISPHTVKTHLYKIFKKINVPNRIQAALWAAKNL